MTELFNETEVTLKSPRLKWMDRRGIKEGRSPCVEDGDEPFYAGQQEIGESGLFEFIQWGNTESEALTRLCQNLGIKLWNEE